MKNKNNLLCVIALVSVFISCTTTAPTSPTVTYPNPNANYGYPYIGMTNNAGLAIKDYQPIEIIFVRIQKYF